MHPKPALVSPFLLLLLLALCLLPQATPSEYDDCIEPLRLHCGSVSLNISYPFTTSGRPAHCGHPNHNVSCSGANKLNQLIITIGNRTYQVKRIDYASEVIILAEGCSRQGDSCPRQLNSTVLDDLFSYTEEDVKVSLFNCRNPPAVASVSLYNLTCQATGESAGGWYYGVDLPDEEEAWLRRSCSSSAVLELSRDAAKKLKGHSNATVFGEALEEGFDVKWKTGNEWCGDCLHTGGVCGYDASAPLRQTCFCREGSRVGSCRSRGKTRKILIALGSLAAGFLLALLAFYLWHRRGQRQTRSISRDLLFQSRSADFSADQDPEALAHSFFHTPIFPYEELEVATGGFDSSKELGDGGFGVVYKGNLKDGRVVAVKRLHERNYRHVQQFRNEVAILSRIRHPNLVSLYGCTSTQDSHQLLLVYEYVPNGTLADHLHGSRASDRLLTWPLRLSIAVETAAALTYLHASEPQIIHRDVKTSNILLDNDFHVKVADFGLSRQFPSLMVTHVSTAPQGTPGYVDPEYHQCYQLTDKSDVYSFGVVLIELLSSMPAVDMGRPRSEINLSNMAMARIPKGMLHDLVDHSLGFDTEPEVKRTMEAVAELAFRCLQPEKDMRPSMDEVRDTLVLMHGEDHETSVSPLREKQMKDDTCLLTSSKVTLSPDTVVADWASRSTTPNTSS